MGTESSFEVGNVRNLDIVRLVDNLLAVDVGVDSWDFEAREDSHSPDVAADEPVRAHLVVVEQDQEHL